MQSRAAKAAVAGIPSASGAIRCGVEIGDKVDRGAIPPLPAASFGFLIGRVGERRGG